MNEKAIVSTVSSLQTIFTIVLALSLGEAFKQFVADKAEKPEDRHIHWNRLTALVSFLLLLIPFYHGMGQYFYSTYISNPRPQPYSLFLMIDVLAFTLEASLFFVMSRALPRIQWRRFYKAVVCILIIDTAWGSIVLFFHPQPIVAWLILNAVFVPVFFLILRRCPAHESIWGPSLAFAAMAVRTVLDYATLWTFYFPQ
jgi:hypothetical protein